ncbi:MAG: hypothetical protein R2828_07645 [Saprospiraceae bacterium]
MTRLAVFSVKQIHTKRLLENGQKLVRKIASEDAIPAVDDTIEQRSPTGNEIICWPWDHSKQRLVKGNNILNFLYHSKLSGGQDISLPTAFEIIEKTEQYVNLKTGQIKRRSAVNKNELLRERLRVLVQLNRLKFKYVVWYTWFSSKENFDLVHYTLKRHLVGALKSNRLVALSE